MYKFVKCWKEAWERWEGYPKSQKKPRGKARSCCDQDLNGHGYACKADIWRESFPCTTTVLPKQAEYISAFLSDGHNVSRTTELTYPRTLEEDPQKPEFDRQMRIQLNVLQEAIAYSVSIADSPFLVPIYQPRSGSSDVGTGANQEQPYEEERLKVEEGGLSIRRGVYNTI